MKIIILNLLIFVMVVGCSGNEKLGKTNDENLFLLAKKNIENGQYLLGIDRLDELKATYPLSEYNQRAQLLKGEALFKQENYQDSIDVYMNFQTLNPGYVNLDYVQWMIAEAYFKSMPETIDRDLSMAYEAINSYTSLINDYPKSKYVKDVGERLKQCHSFIFDREMYIADFYFKTKKYMSSASRYKEILSSSAPSSYKKKAYVKYVKSLANDDDFGKCLEALKTNSVVNFMSTNEEKSLKNRCAKGLNRN